MAAEITSRVAEQLYRIKVSLEFTELRHYLRQLYQDSLELLPGIQDEVVLRREQGKALATKELLDRIEKSDATLARMK